MTTPISLPDEVLSEITDALAEKWITPEKPEPIPIASAMLEQAAKNLAMLRAIAQNAHVSKYMKETGNTIVIFPNFSTLYSPKSTGISFGLLVLHSRKCGSHPRSNVYTYHDSDYPVNRSEVLDYRTIKTDSLSKWHPKQLYRLYSLNQEQTWEIVFNSIRKYRETKGQQEARRR